MEIYDVTGIRTAQTDSATQAVKTARTGTDAAVRSDEKTTDDNAAAKQRWDTYVKSDETVQEKTGIYSKESIAKTVESAEERRAQAFVSMLNQMFGKQGEKAGIASLDLNAAIQKNFTQEDLDAASASIADGGEYSVDAVATRIMDFAMALAGDDPTKISTLRDAVTQGFGQAADTLGLRYDDMPGITHSTYDEVMKRFDDWEKSYQTDDTATVVTDED